MTVTAPPAAPQPRRTKLLGAGRSWRSPFVHPLVHGSSGRLHAPSTIALGATAVLVPAGQLLGVVPWRRRRGRPGAGARERARRTADPVA